MKLGRRSILLVIILISFGILLGSLLIYLKYTQKIDPYDKELLTSGISDEVQTTKDHVEETFSADENTAQITILKDQPEQRVTEGNGYSEKLVADGSKNILLLGEDKENMLYDTIGVASIDSKCKKVSIIMLPRDMYVDYNKSINDVIQIRGKSKVAGIHKLNYSHYIGAMIGYKGKFNANSISFLAQVIKEKFKIDVDDYMKINVEGLNQVVDIFGGVDIKVPYDMNYDDPIQKLSIHLDKGEHHINGKQAEGFVRFRQGYKNNGTKFDVDRKKNQLAFLKTFIKQHGTISNINKLPDLLKTLDRNIMHSMDFGDILLTYIGIAKDIVNDKYVIEDINIDGEDRRVNGISYEIIK